MSAAAVGMGLPLDVAPDPEMEVEAYTLIVDDEGRVLADCGVLGWSTDDQERVAAHLVGCANAYPALVEALEKAAGDIEMAAARRAYAAGMGAGEWESFTQTWEADVLRDIRHALAATP